MAKLPICRICLSSNLKNSDIINNELQEIYQKLTCLAFNMEDSRPNVVCSYCVALLKKALALKLECQAAEEFFSKYLDNNVTELGDLALPIKTKERFLVSPVQQVSINPRHEEAIGNIEDQIMQEIKIEKDPLSPCEITYEVKMEPTEDEFEHADSLSNDMTYKTPSDESSTESDHKLSCMIPSSYTSATEKDHPLLRVCLEKKFQEPVEEHDMDAQNDKPEEDNSSAGKKGKDIRKKDNCYYCDKSILNFSRHMTNIHGAELEVQRALSFPKNSLQRKQSFMALRKKGNYSAFKPMKSCSSEKTEYLPCTNCLGIYSKKRLWIHVRKCSANTSTNNMQIKAQNFLIRDLEIDNILVTKVFPHMKPDNISLVAKKDKLICVFAIQFLETHHEKHFITVISRKMRELAKLLLEVMKLKPNINSLEQILNPQYYETLVQATKIIARYDANSQQFNAPTYAVKIATSIKQCCDIILTENSKKEASAETAATEADTRQLCKMIKDNWRYHISSQATDDLSVKKWNKTTIVPLARDLKVLIDYLHRFSQQSIDILAQSEKYNVEAFDNLVESTYCRVLLLNRMRPGDILEVTLSDYTDYENDRNKTFTEFDENLTSMEKMLVNDLKRFVIRGKSNRGVPVLFSSKVQEDMKKILLVRHMYVTDDSNKLFVKAGGLLIQGYKIFENYTVASGIKNYRNLTSARPRKLLAMMSQLFYLTEAELERLATLMGHTLNADKDNKLPSEAYHTANVCKLLLLIEDCNQGTDLDDIDVSLEYEEAIENETEKPMEEDPPRNRKTSAKKKRVK